MPKVNFPPSSSLNPWANDFQPPQTNASNQQGSPLVEAYKAAQVCISRNLAPSVQKESVTAFKSLTMTQADMSADEVLDSLWQLSEALQETLRPIERTNQGLNRSGAADLLAWNEQLSNNISGFFKTLAPQEAHALLELMSGRFCSLRLLLGAISEQSPGIQLLNRMAKEYCQPQEAAVTQLQPDTLSTELNDRTLIQEAIDANKSNQQKINEQDGSQFIDQSLDGFINKLERHKQTKQPRQKRIQSVLKSLSLPELSNLVSSIETWHFRKENAHGILDLKDRPEKHKNCFELAMGVLSEWPSITKEQATTGQIIEALNLWSDEIATQAQPFQTSPAVHIKRSLLSADYYSALVSASVLSGKHQILNGVKAFKEVHNFIGILISGHNNYTTVMQGLDATPVIGKQLKKIYTDLLDTLSKQINPNGSFDQEFSARFNPERAQMIEAMVDNCYKHRIAQFENALLNNRPAISEHLCRISAVAGIRQFGNLMEIQPNIVSRLGLRRSPSNFVLFHLLTEVTAKIQAITQENQPKTEAATP